MFVYTSSTLFKVDVKRAKELIDIFGIEKVLFGTDYPLWNVEEELERFMKINLSENERKQILWDNAAGLLGI